MTRLRRSVCERIAGSILVALSPAPVLACGTTDVSVPDGGYPELCRLPAAPGNCLAYGPSYYHDTKTDLCTPFVYGGCGGNENRFATQEDCYAACDAGTPDRGACSVPSDCILANTSCCAACDPVDKTAFVALNHRYAADYVRIKGCDGVACAPCPDVAEERRSSQDFVATCRLGRCVAMDIRTTPATECRISTDCVLRDGAACCEGCDAKGIVSIASIDALSALVCDSHPTTCDACAPQIPPELQPACEAGRCRVVRVPLPNQ